jgi:hypothetical protein
MTIGEAWRREQPHLRALPAHDYACCHSAQVCLNPYSQITFETNHYSVPTDQAYRELTLKAYPLRVELWHGETLIARHLRCYGRGQDILDPLHYLPLLQQRPGAFRHAKPLRRWRAEWPPVYEELLARLQAEKPDGQGLREFLQILNLHRAQPAEQMEQAIRLALEYGCAHLDGVTLCLHQLQHPTPPLRALDLSDRPHLNGIGTQSLDLRCYDQLLSGEV